MKSIKIILAAVGILLLGQAGQAMEPKEDTQVTFEKFPNEVQLLILNKLDTKSLFRFLQTNKELHNKWLLDKGLLKQFSKISKLDLSGRGIQYFSLPYLKKIFPQLQELNLANNAIQTLRHEHVANMGEQFRLTLDNNPITTIEKNCFDATQDALYCNLDIKNTSLTDQSFLDHGFTYADLKYDDRHQELAQQLRHPITLAIGLGSGALTAVTQKLFLTWLHNKVGLNPAWHRIYWVPALATGLVTGFANNFFSHGLVEGYAHMKLLDGCHIKIDLTNSVGETISVFKTRGCVDRFVYSTACHVRAVWRDLSGQSPFS